MENERNKIEQNCENNLSYRIFDLLEHGDVLTFDDVVECCDTPSKAFSTMKYLVRTGFLKEKRNGKYAILCGAEDILEIRRATKNFKKRYSEDEIEKFCNLSPSACITTLDVIDANGGATYLDIYAEARFTVPYNPLPYLLNYGAVVYYDGKYYSTFDTEVVRNTYVNCHGEGLSREERELNLRRWRWKEPTDDIDSYFSRLKNETDWDGWGYDDYADYGVVPLDYDFEIGDVTEEEVAEKLNEFVDARINAYKEELDKEDDDEDDEDDEEENNRRRDLLRKLSRAEATSIIRDPSDDHLRERLYVNMTRKNRFDDYRINVIGENGKKVREKEQLFNMSGGLNNIAYNLAYEDETELQGLLDVINFDAKDYKITRGKAIYDIVDKMYVQVSAEIAEIEKADDTYTYLKYDEIDVLKEMVENGKASGLEDKVFLDVMAEELFRQSFDDLDHDGVLVELALKRELTVFLTFIKDEEKLNELRDDQTKFAVSTAVTEIVFVNEYGKELNAWLNVERRPDVLLEIAFAFNGEDAVKDYFGVAEMPVDVYDPFLDMDELVESVEILVGDEHVPLDMHDCVLPQLEQEQILKLRGKKIFRITTNPNLRG